MKFTYNAERDGQTYSGTVEASDRFEDVRSEGGSIINVQSDSKSKWSFAYWNSKFSSVKEHDKIILASNLSAIDFRWSFYFTSSFSS